MKTIRPGITATSTPDCSADLEVDLFEAIMGSSGSLDRAHHHPACSGWEPRPRYFVDGLSTQPIEWLAARLSDLDALLEQAGMITAAYLQRALLRADPGKYSRSGRDQDESARASRTFSANVNCCHSPVISRARLTRRE